MPGRHALLKTCVVCGMDKTRLQFTRSQWERDSRYRCRECMNGGGVPGSPGAGSNGDTETEDRSRKSSGARKIRNHVNTVFANLASEVGCSQDSSHPRVLEAVLERLIDLKLRVGEPVSDESRATVAAVAAARAGTMAANVSALRSASAAADTTVAAAKTMTSLANTTMTRSRNLARFASNFDPAAYSSPIAVATPMTTNDTPTPSMVAPRFAAVASPTPVLPSATPRDGPTSLEDDNGPDEYDLSQWAEVVANQNVTDVDGDANAAKRNKSMIPVPDLDFVIDWDAIPMMDYAEGFT